MCDWDEWCVELNKKSYVGIRRGSLWVSKIEEEIIFKIPFWYYTQNNFHVYLPSIFNLSSRILYWTNLNPFRFLSYFPLFNWQIHNKIHT